MKRRQRETKKKKQHQIEKYTDSIDGGERTGQSTATAV